MPTVKITVRQHGVPQLEAVRAYAKNQDEGMNLDDIIAEGDVVNYQGSVPGNHAFWSVQVVMAAILPMHAERRCLQAPCASKARIGFRPAEKDSSKHAPQHSIGMSRRPSRDQPAR